MPLHGRLSLLPAAAPLIGDPRPQILTRACCLVPDARLHISTFREFPKRGSSPASVGTVLTPPSMALPARLSIVRRAPPPPFRAWLTSSFGSWGFPNEKFPACVVPTLSASCAWVKP